MAEEMENQRAQVLIEALPHIQKYYGKTVVVKYGGNAMINETLKDAVIHDIVLLSLVGVRVVVVHGGGPEISGMLKKIGKQSEFVNGLRYTDRETMDIVQMVLCGKVNKDLVSLLGNAGGAGVGLSGMDGGLFQAVRKIDADGTDYGYVGNIVKVNPEPVVDMLEHGYIPVVSTVALGVDDDTNYNINADLAAAKLAVALQAEKLILLTDVRGLLMDRHDENTLLPEVKVSAVPKLIKDGIIAGGMI
ncbi:MAG: acetylglutamate kinase, partial [Butyricicoccus porcorum]